MTAPVLSPSWHDRIRLWRRGSTRQTPTPVGGGDDKKSDVSLQIPMAIKLVSIWRSDYAAEKTLTGMARPTEAAMERQKIESATQQLLLTTGQSYEYVLAIWLASTTTRLHACQSDPHILCRTPEECLELTLAVYTICFDGCIPWSERIWCALRFRREVLTVA